MMETRLHPVFDFDWWKREFPLDDFIRSEYARSHEGTDSCFLNNLLETYRLGGRQIFSPIDLVITEQVRARVGREHDLGSPVPVDVFLWELGEPRHPYLTKVGGIPHREASRAWPHDKQGNPFTFMFQLCFLDSADVLPAKLPGDVLLFYYRCEEGYDDLEADYYFEWSKRILKQPIKDQDCPQPAFERPRLAGVIHRMNEYPESEPIFKRLGHVQPYYFSQTQSTKIGRSGCKFQFDAHKPGAEEVFCTISSIWTNRKRWPFVNCSFLPGENADDLSGAGPYHVNMGDIGFLNFTITPKGRIAWIDQFT